MSYFTINLGYEIRLDLVSNLILELGFTIDKSHSNVQYQTDSAKNRTESF